jgi:hypothetical protein
MFISAALPRLAVNEIARIAGSIGNGRFILSFSEYPTLG